MINAIRHGFRMFCDTLGIVGGLYVVFICVDNYYERIDKD